MVKKLRLPAKLADKQYLNVDAMAFRVDMPISEAQGQSGLYTGDITMYIANRGQVKGTISVWNADHQRPHMINVNDTVYVARNTYISGTVGDA